MKKFFATVMIALALMVSGGGMLSPVYAQDPTDSAKAQVCNGVTGNATSGSCAAGGANLSKIIAALLNVLSVVAGIAAVIMIIVSGLKYITSNGDAQAVAGAKRTLIYAIVGLVVVAASQVIVKFVIAKVNG